MASHSHISSQNRPNGHENGVDSDVSRSIVEGLNEINWTIDQLRREFHNSLDLNFPISDSISIETGCIFEENKVTEMGMDQVNEENANIDLSLSLSSPIVNSRDHQESSNSSEMSSPTKSQVSCMSLDLNANIEDQESTNPLNNNNNNEEDLPSLILMGCTHCHIYVMVSEADPKCPRCNSSVLLDIFRESPANKLKKNQPVI